MIKTFVRLSSSEKKPSFMQKKRGAKRRLTVLRHPPDMGKIVRAIYLVFQKIKCSFSFWVSGKPCSIYKANKKSKLPSMTTRRIWEHENWKLFCHRARKKSHKTPAALSEAAGGVNKVDYPAIISVTPHAIIIQSTLFSPRNSIATTVPYFPFLSA